MTWVQLELLLLTSAVTGVAIYFRHYLAEKAKNLATKEDVAQLTRTVEAVKSEFRVQEEFLRANLSHEATLRKAQLEIELSSYRDIWQRFLELERSLIKLQSLCLARGTTSSLIPDAYTTFQRQKDDLGAEAERIEPFVAVDVSRDITLAVLNLRYVAGVAFTTIAHTPEERDERIKEWVATTGQARRDLSAALRQRLFGSIRGVQQATSGTVAPGA